MDTGKNNEKDFVWVLTLFGAGEERFLGLDTAEGQPFIPVTRTKGEAEVLLTLIPGDQSTRQVETIHQANILEEAQKQGFQVLMVDAQGAVKGPLEAMVKH